MPNYGPPGRGGPEPWHGRRPDKAYDPSAGSSERGVWEAPHTSYPPPTHGGEPYAGGLPPDRRRGRRPVLAVLATVTVLALVGGAAVFYLLGQDEGASVGTSGGPAPAAGTATSGAPASETPPAPTAPAPESSADPRFAKAGQCVRNDGVADGRPKLLITDCARQTYEVLRRIDGATSGEKDAAAKCAEVNGYTNWYFFDSELDTLDFVLCLKQR
ncbi:hypothetical protein [Micromonospora sp. NPDC047074]|uniref:LppU/SCO3897 family protein n=1 Tax=Micromonospora sp. NPDC047074 TaxID=3154339 RepID=UPI0033C752A2